MLGKKFFLQSFGEKKSLPKPNHLYTPSKVKRTTLNPIFWVTVAIKSRFVAFFSPALRAEHYVFFYFKNPFHFKQRVRGHIVGREESVGSVMAMRQGLSVMGLN